MPELVPGGRDEAPVAGPGVVVQGQDIARFLRENLHVELTEGHARALSHPLRQLSHALGHGESISGRYPVPDEVLDAGITRSLEQGPVVGRIPRGHDHGRMLESLHEQAALVIHGGGDRPAHPVETSLREPFLCRGEERPGDLRLVRALEEAEEAQAIAVMLVVPAVLDRGDPPERCSVTPRDEEGPICVPIEGIPLSVQEVLHHGAERRHPLRAPSGLNHPRHVHEARHAPVSLDLLYLDHASPLLFTDFLPCLAVYPRRRARPGGHGRPEQGRSHARRPRGHGECTC